MERIAVKTWRCYRKIFGLATTDKDRVPDAASNVDVATGALDLHMPVRRTQITLQK